eukprot:CAMPEP_0117470208 /NCGR_PEP_ID=MMETSP0784-20121206/7092_1 /TAXON_ID=39447 /ORGANISM="" /LENGTH=93 /DNA_ID=CAMNT_0005264279 /DNA_START=540 /DNA_END=821 /DNA_ORIENTATION=-
MPRTAASPAPVPPPACAPLLPLWHSLCQARKTARMELWPCGRARVARMPERRVEERSKQTACALAQVRARGLALRLHAVPNLLGAPAAAHKRA